jgi:hypothetical protein
MRKVPALALIFTLALVGLTPASAATKAQIVTTAFKTLLNTTGESLAALEQKYETDIDALDATLAATTQSADDTYNNDLLAATNLFAPQITAANKKAEDAKLSYESNNKVRLTTGFFG